MLLAAGVERFGVSLVQRRPAAGPGGDLGAQAVVVGMGVGEQHGVDVLRAPADVGEAALQRRARLRVVVAGVDEREAAVVADQGVHRDRGDLGVGDGEVDPPDTGRDPGCSTVCDG